MFDSFVGEDIESSTKC